MPSTITLRRARSSAATRRQTAAFAMRLRRQPAEQPRSHRVPIDARIAATPGQRACQGRLARAGQAHQQDQAGRARRRVR
jgi:hypothetical protein